MLMKLIRRFHPGLAYLAAAFLFLSSGCSNNPTEPQPTPAVEGSVVKHSQPVVGTTVSLYNDENYSLLDTTITDQTGDYRFNDIPDGRWLVKTVSEVPDEFGYVRYIFSLNPDTPEVVVPTMDVSTHGLSLLEPGEDDSVPTPDPFSPLDFVWSAYQGQIEWNNTRLYSEYDSLIWSSTKNSDTIATFDGVMNEGGSSGNPVQPGTYEWRVKLKFPNSTKAATRKETVIFE